jgi:hypothetical protein
MSRAELEARIAALEDTLASKPCRQRGARSADKARERARRKQFKLDAWKRAHLHLSINRYYC